MSHQDAAPGASAATARPAAELPTDAKKGGDHLGNGWRHTQLQRSGQLLRKIEHMCARDLRHKMRVNNGCCFRAQEGFMATGATSDATDAAIGVG